MKLGDMAKNQPKKYYIVVEEWNYPAESGREIVGDFDNSADAINKCRELAIDEESNFEYNCKVDALPAEAVCDTTNIHDYRGFIVTPKNGLDPYFYFARVVEVTSFN